MDFTLSDEQQLIRETAREFCDAEIAPHAAEWDRAETIDRGIVGKLAELGFLAAALPEEHGGMGLDMVSYALVVEEIGRADSNVRGIVSVSNGLYGKTRRAAGAPTSRRRASSPALASGEELGCYALTEPGAGSDPGGLETRAERDGDDWVLQRPEDLHHARLVGGARARLRAHRRAGPARDHVLRRPDRRRRASRRGRSRASSGCARRTRPSSSSTACACRTRTGSASSAAASRSRCRRSTTGASRSAPAASGSRRAASTRRSRTRRSAGSSAAPVASFQLVQELLADIAVETEAARLLVWRAAATADRGERHTVEASYAKYFASEVAVRAANAAVQAHGGYGYVDEYPVGKYLRDARVTTLYEGTSQIQKLLIGRALTGENAFA